MKFYCKLNSNLVRLIFYLSIPFILIICIPHFSADGTVICLSKIFFGTECPGCGMIRATNSLLNFDFAKAFSYNKLVFIVIPIFTFYWIKKIIHLIYKSNLLTKRRSDVA